MSHKKQKSLHELTLLDRFLFAEAMENPENMEILLEICLGRDISLELPTQTEKELRRSSLKRFARIDVWAEDRNHNLYDTEVQKENPHNLFKRTCYYQGMIDSNLLPPGETDFNKLKPVYIIVITPFDLFGYGLYRYTFCGQCLEIPQLHLEDDATRIFFNTHGSDAANVSPELIELLHFMEHTNDMLPSIQSNKVRRLEQNVRNIQDSKEVGVKYMQLWEEFALERAEARAEGREKGLAEERAEGRAEGHAEGRAEGRAEAHTASIISFLDDLGEIPSALMDRINFESNPQTLQSWVKLAARAESISDFEEKIN